jgi:NAD(P)-dependent dehydrogenase (short-subunit alcohol dehydrogenase family)
MDKRAGMLEGKVLFLAGAGPKMGAATARIAAREGAKVVLVARTSGRNDELARSIRDAGGQALPLICDFTDRAQLKAAVDAALSEYGRIDSVFYNAAFYDHDQSSLEFDEATWEASMGVNLRAPLELARLVVPTMVQNGGGSLVFNSSASSLTAEETRMFYGVSKSALNAVIRFIATNFGRQGVRANGILPFVFAAFGEAEARMNCLGRSGTAEEIGEVVAFLCSDRSSIITGELIHLDGGQFARAQWPSVRPNR